MAEQPKVKIKNGSKFEMTLKFALVLAFLAAGARLFLFSSPASDSLLETKHKEAGISRETFAKCLNEKGLIMYGIDTCEFCQAQKKMFGSDFEKINYINCYFDQDKCLKAGADGYPVWIIGEKKVSGIQKFSSLAALTGCEAPN